MLFGLNFLGPATILFILTSPVNAKIKVLKGNDPGSCDKSNKGEALLVRNRQDKLTLLVCTKRKEGYAWRTTEGSTTPGEFFNPGYDCSSILDSDPKVTDGFYWINLNKKNPIKVWCDMTTDGGGFMLVGRQNNAISWTVPSNNKPVEPFGTPHWSSALGQAPIVDFRIQMAIANDSSQTKAHWFYRLNSPRKLRNLMIRDKGCDHSSPGIGDIAFVKDLIADEIVTRNFQCSKFGIGHHPETKFGWNMMNSCLQRPCRYGFAFHHKFPIQTDYSGAFSYSVTKNISGINHGATAFVGCSNGYCCGCYGPIGGENNYCFKKCQARNKGKIITKVFTWFWLRSSLPKRVWNKCMEYKVTEKGAGVWYKLKGNSQIPIKGRCAKDKGLLYDGMLLVPNNKTAEEVPFVEGMVMYRKDNQKLYISGNETWNEVAQKEKVMNRLNKGIAQLEKKIDIELKAISDWKQKANMKLVNVEKILEKIMQLGSNTNPGKSCFDIRQRSRVPSMSSGEYYISIENRLMRVFCDMRTDGGGWTLISNIVLQDSNGFKWSLATDYHKISDYNSKKLGLSSQALHDLKQRMPFTQLRFYCHKKRPGRTFHIVTKNNTLGNNVVRYFTGQTNSMPKACGSFARLPNDNSKLASQCSKWGYESGKYSVGKWHHAGVPVASRLFDHPAFIASEAHWIVPTTRGGRWECDDYISKSGFTRSSGDTWKIFVR